ncbi:hypothetical protein N7453_006928 [Penicillium expansum]|nr:hypothetical protein N7453_006928 [Penicillium expansum]
MYLPLQGAHRDLSPMWSLKRLLQKAPVSNEINALCGHICKRLGALNEQDTETFKQRQVISIARSRSRHQQLCGLTAQSQDQTRLVHC